jgi:Predicted dehydrogenases and related proteins
MNVGVIGAGLIGSKRAYSVLKSGDNLLQIADIDINKAKLLSKSFPKSTATNKWQDIIKNDDIDSVIVSTTHNYLTHISYKALKSGKNVLAEKPLGISKKEVIACVRLANKKKLTYKAGYNHRFHPGITKAKTILDQGKIGQIMYINAIYGHGGRPGYEKEWRMDKKISGGGETIDQGAHLIDLALWFYGSTPKEKVGFPLTLFWDIKVEDNVFIILKDKNFIANIHAGWTEWKNRFYFEIYGKTGYLKIDGLGGSYGVETLTYGVRIPGKAPKEKSWKFEQLDESWGKEWNDFKRSINLKDSMGASGEDGLKVLQIIEEIYRSNEK